MAHALLYCGQWEFPLLSRHKTNTIVVHPLPLLLNFQVHCQEDRSFWKKPSNKAPLCGPGFINCKDWKTPLHILSSLPSIPLPSGTCGSTASKCLQSPRQRPLALETSGTETGGVVRSKHRREGKTKSSEEPLHVEFSFAFRAVGNAPAVPGPFEGSALTWCAVSRSVQEAFVLRVSGWIIFYNHLIAGLSSRGRGRI